MKSARTFESGAGTLYVDGVSVGEKTFTLSTAIDAGVRIGSKGAYDELSFYNTALTPQQVTAHWTSN